MKASSPNISNPLSRRKKSGGGSTIIVGLFILVVAVLGVFYLTVYQGVFGSSEVKRAHEYKGPLLDGIPHPNLPGFERHKRHGGEVNHLRAANDAYHGTLTLHTDLGEIKIDLRPDWSPESVNYIHELAQAGCEQCSFYRAEKPGIFQGKMNTDSVVNPQVKGECPLGTEQVEEKCPEHDPKCACHGPIMRRSFVAWAGGGTGPDFFVDTYQNPAKFWGHQHT